MAINKELNEKELEQVSGGRESARDFKNDCGEQISDANTLKACLNQELYFVSKTNTNNIFYGKLNSVEDGAAGSFKCNVTVTKLPYLTVLQLKVGDNLTLSSIDYKFYKKKEKEETAFV